VNVDRHRLMLNADRDEQGSTENGASAWLVRLSDEGLAKPASEGPVFGKDSLLALADGKPSHDYVMFPMRGTVAFSINGTRLNKVRLDLQTVGPVPFYNWPLRVGQRSSASAREVNSPAIIKCTMVLERLCTNWNPFI
jgi:hypothetical protein